MELVSCQLVLALLALQGNANEPSLDVHIRRGIEHLVRIQKSDGSFGPSNIAKGDVGTTGLAVQALALATSINDHNRLRAMGRGLRFLELRIQNDGLVYDPAEGLRLFKSAMAAQAFRVSNIPHYHARSIELENRIGSAARFESQSISDESRAESQANTVDANRLSDISAASDADEDTSRAIDFLLQLDLSDRNDGNSLRATEKGDSDSPPGYLPYESLPSLICRDLTLQDSDVIAVIRALREKFTLFENPDLTRRFASRGKSGGAQGLYFNLYVVARVLSLLPKAEFVTVSGESHDWITELSDRICSLQRPDGSWWNDDPRWWEGSSALATSYAILALCQCQARRAALEGTQSSIGK